MSQDEQLQKSSDAQQQQNINSAYVSFKHNTALALLIGAPVLIALPPRKLDLYTFSLISAFAVSANHLTREKTGRNIIQLVGSRYQRTSYDINGNGNNSITNSKSVIEQTAVQKQIANLPSGSSASFAKTSAFGTGNRGGSNWKEERLREEQEKLDNGEGYADMIVDQIWDVWNQKKDGDGNGGGADGDDKK